MKKYTAPELEIMEFELEDVLTLSDGLADDAKNKWESDSNGRWF